ncbi:MAG: alpha/beta fold hydrolase, partial [Deltaproteobacteria bacterium]|nr:alpha/beta fold hydrolase [Deltaproteobacteria bacterium]
MESRKEGKIGFITGNWPLDKYKPTLVFIHGSALNSSLWESQVEDLGDIANTVAIDLPGRGSSNGVEKVNIEDYARIVIEFIDLIEAPHPIPCGLSLGGAITQ